MKRSELRTALRAAARVARQTEFSLFPFCVVGLRPSRPPQQAEHYPQVVGVVHTFLLCN